VDFEGRRERLVRRIRREGCDALLVSHVPNVRYLTGFTGSDATLVLTPQHAVLVSDGRYQEQIRQECVGLEAEIRRPPRTWTEAVSSVVRRLHAQRITFEHDRLTVRQWAELTGVLKSSTLVAVEGWVEELRQIKDRDELRLLRCSIEAAERAFQACWQAMSPSWTERQLATQLEYQVRLAGAESTSFPPIVAAGPHAARPHAQPRAVPLGDGSFVLVDWGARLDGYCSDLTRVVPLARISPKLERLYAVVRAAQQAALAVLRPGISLAEVDQAARGVIQNAGLARYFNHGLGHGLGLEIHESPRLAPKQQQLVRAGMVITLEPGVYMPGWGGVRVEDDVLVTRAGARVLTHVSADLADLLRA